MRRLMWQRMVVMGIVGLFIVLLTVSCRVESTHIVAVQETAYPVPSRQANVAAVSTSPPTASPKLIPATPTRSSVAFDLTILHTAEVAGEVSPCG